MLRRTLFVCFAGFVLAAPAPVLAQAFAVPISDKVIEGELLLPDGSTVRFFVREGSMLTVQSEVDGYWYGFIPQVLRVQDNRLRFTTFEIRQRASGGQSLEQISSPIDSIDGASVDIQTRSGSFQISPLDVALWRFPKHPIVNPEDVSPYALQKVFGKSGGGLCCVTCGDITVCGGAVIMSCGSCDSGGGGRPAI